MIPHPAENSEAAHSDGEVRRTIARVLGEHLMGSGSTPSWSEFNFDLRGALFHDLSLEGAHFTGGSVIFDNAVFTGRLTSFKGVHFSCDLASFDFAEFKAGTTLFEGAVFDSKSLRFGGTTFLGDSTVFDSAYFKSDAAWFGGTEFRSRVTSFTKTTYSGGGVHFAGSTFGSPLTVFSDATFGGTVTFFGSAQFLGKSVTFEGVNWESRVELHDIIVSKETLIEGLAPLVELGGYQYLEDGPRHFRSGAPSATSQQ